MKPKVSSKAGIFYCLIALCMMAPSALLAAEWNQFRGPYGTGVSEDSSAPVTFGTEDNLVWRTAMPAGKSSPVFAGDRIFVTGHDGELLVTLSVDAGTGEILWRREVEREYESKRTKLNDAAAPTPATDGEALYVFFADFGLLSYTLDGEERWRLPIPPAEVMHGVAASPVVHEGTVVLVIDQKKGSHVLAVDAETGNERWRADRLDSFAGVYSSPMIYIAKGKPAQLVTLRAGAVIAYSLESGEQLWQIGRMPLQPRATPTQSDGLIYVSIHGFQETHVPLWKVLIEKMDKNGNGLFDLEEKPPGVHREGFLSMDMDGDRSVSQDEWNAFRKIAVDGTLMAIRPSGREVLTQESVVWTSQEPKPNVSSPLVYRGVLYLVKNGGRLIALDALSGELLKEGRLTGALGAYYASPVAAAGKVYAASEEGKVAVVKAGRQWELLTVNDLGEEIFATPAIVGGRLYVRTAVALYCFEETQAK